MSDRAKRALVALWLFLTVPINVAMLKHLIRDAFRLIAGLYAGLDRWQAVQYIVALIFVLWVIIWLVRGSKHGHTLAVVLLLGSCCIIVGQILLDMVCTISGDLYWPRPLGWAMFGAIVSLNLICLRTLTGKKPVPP
jgi:hypothetical protein